MPIVAASSFRPAPGLANGHLQTIWPVLFRRVPLVTTDRERLELADGDFLDLDWARNDNHRRLVILTHGLESHSRDASVQSMARAFFQSGWDVLAWNMRGCSGAPNRLLRFYHSGATEDLAVVLAHASPGYDKVALVSFSLGGNLTLKYLGETTTNIVGAVAFSVPCDLTSSVNRLDAAPNGIYTRRFIRKLRQKIEDKKQRFPDLLNVEKLAAMRTFHEFDAAYTAPLHGFASADEYWQKASCLGKLARISVPTLVVNARNDPFLGEACFPNAIAQDNPFLHLEIPESGGHCGFVSTSANWQENRALAFLTNL